MDELHRRSLIKGITWRVLATADTILLAFIFTGSFTAAFSIGGLEVLTKFLWYYFHERVWLKFQTPHFEYDSHSRTAVKALSWRFVGVLDTMLVSFLVTGRIATSASIGGTELITKLLLYYFHERFWLHVHWGVGRNLHHELTVAEVIKDAEFVWKKSLKAAMYAAGCIMVVAAVAFVAYYLRG